MDNRPIGKKGNSGIFSIVGVVLALVVVGITLVVGFNIVTSLQSGQTANSFAANGTGNVLAGLNTLSAQVPLIALVAALGIILAVLFGFLGGFIGGKGRY
jgi:hypothetical protein